MMSKEDDVVSKINRTGILLEEVTKIITKKSEVTVLECNYGYSSAGRSDDIDLLVDKVGFGFLLFECVSSGSRPREWVFLKKKAGYLHPVSLRYGNPGWEVRNDFRSNHEVFTVFVECNETNNDKAKMNFFNKLTQVLRNTQHKINNLPIDVIQQPNHPFPFFIPLIVTNIPLYTAEYDDNDIDFSTARLNRLSADLKSAEWVAFDHVFPMQSPASADRPLCIIKDHTQDHTKTLFVVNIKSLKKFLDSKIFLVGDD